MEGKQEGRELSSEEFNPWNKEIIGELRTLEVLFRTQNLKELIPKVRQLIQQSAPTPEDSLAKAQLTFKKNSMCLKFGENKFTISFFPKEIRLLLEVNGKDSIGLICPAAVNLIEARRIDGRGREYDIKPTPDGQTMSADENSARTLLYIFQIVRKNLHRAFELSLPAAVETPGPFRDTALPDAAEIKVIAPSEAPEEHKTQPNSALRIQEHINKLNQGIRKWDPVQKAKKAALEKIQTKLNNPGELSKELEEYRKNKIVMQGKSSQTADIINKLWLQTVDPTFTPIKPATQKAIKELILNLEEKVKSRSGIFFSEKSKETNRALYELRTFQKEIQNEGAEVACKKLYKRLDEVQGLLDESIKPIYTQLIQDVTDEAAQPPSFGKHS